MTGSLLDSISNLTVGDIIDSDDPVTLLRTVFGSDAIRGVAASDDLAPVPLVLLKWNEQWHCLVFLAHQPTDEVKFWASPADRPRILHDALDKPLGTSNSDPVALVRSLLDEDERFRDYQDSITDSEALHFIRMLLALNPDVRHEMNEAINLSDSELLGDLHDEALWEAHIWEPTPTDNPRGSLGAPDLTAPVFDTTLGELAAATDPGPLFTRLYGTAAIHTERIRQEDLEADEVHVLLARNNEWHFLHLADEYDYDWRTISVRSTLLLAAIANPWKDPVEISPTGNLTAAQSLATFHANYTKNVGSSDWTSLAFLRMLLDQLPDEERSTVQTMLALSHTSVAANL